MSFASFGEERENLTQATLKVQAVAAALGSGHRVRDLQAVHDRLISDRFRVLFVGNFDAGKSTLINAMLGDEVLPARFLPTTGIVTVVRYGSERRAFFCPPHNSEGPTPPPVRVPISEFEKHLTIAEDGAGPSLYSRAEIEWPADILRNGVEIIDSPGLDDPLKDGAVRMESTIRQVAGADIVVYVSACGGAMGRGDMNFIHTYLHPLGHQELHIVLTKIDTVPPSQRDRFVNAATRNLTSFAPAERIFFVNALGGLEARMSSNDEQLVQSSLPALERSIEEHLGDRRGTVKLLAPATGIKYVIGEMSEVVRKRENNLALHASEVRQNCARVNEILPLLERQCDRIDELVGYYLREIEPEVEEIAKKFMRDAAEQCQGWVGDMPEGDSLRLQDAIRMRERLEAAARRTAGHLESRFQHAFTKWQEDELNHLLRNRVARMEEKVKSDLREFLDVVHRAEQALAGDHAVESSPTVHDSSALDQVLDDLIAPLPGANPEVAGASGVSQLLSQLWWTISAGLVLLLLRSVAVTVVARVLTQFWKRPDSAVTYAVVSEFSRQLGQEEPNWGVAIRKTVASGLGDLQAAINSALTSKVLHIGEQSQALLADIESNTAGQRLAGLANDLEQAAVEVEATLQRLHRA
ncbi:hypothetical protein STRAU_4757 [Streptomyces aurantiacus JA 4570]|uniref:Dynamin N-terminal domain-containing protein n=2 Tax=Streptomyces aurantiacus TaxID=47760 RepID=S4AL66_9ACTN|nr:hypothetical protein STRAU_4757 [Streptomyces aurantiacus JA 4570]